AAEFGFASTTLPHCSIAASHAWRCSSSLQNTARRSWPRYCSNAPAICAAACFACDAAKGATSNSSPVVGTTNLVVTCRSLPDSEYSPHITSSAPICTASCRALMQSVMSASFRPNFLSASLRTLSSTGACVAMLSSALRTSLPTSLPKLSLAPAWGASAGTRTRYRPPSCASAGAAVTAAAATAATKASGASRRWLRARSISRVSIGDMDTESDRLRPHQYSNPLHHIKFAAFATVRRLRRTTGPRTLFGRGRPFYVQSRSRRKERTASHLGSGWPGGWHASGRMLNWLHSGTEGVPRVTAGSEHRLHRRQAALA